MFNYIVIQDTVWTDEQFNIETHPTIVATSQLSGEVYSDAYHLFEGGEIGKIFIEGVMYNDPSEIPEGGEE